jgi:hypothetical protein
MTTMTKLSALTLVAATVLGAAALAPTSASAKGYVGGFHRTTNSGNGIGNFHLRATALAGAKLMPFRQSVFAVRRVFAPPTTMMPLRQNAFAAGFKFAPLRQIALAGQPVARIGVTTPVSHQPPRGGNGGNRHEIVRKSALARPAPTAHARDIETGTPAAIQTPEHSVVAAGRNRCR